MEGGEYSQGWPKSTQHYHQKNIWEMLGDTEDPNNHWMSSVTPQGVMTPLTPLLLALTLLMWARLPLKEVMKVKSEEVKIVKEVTACDILPVVMFPSRIEISWTVDRDPLRCLSDVHTYSDSSQLTDYWWSWQRPSSSSPAPSSSSSADIFPKRVFISKQPTSFLRPELSSRVSQMRKLPELKFKWHSIQSKQW